VLKSPVASALSLVVSFLGLAALFISLNAYFIGIIQILVYAGAVMVLFLFIIMLLDLKAAPKEKGGLLAVLGGLAVIGVFTVQLIGLTSTFEAGKVTLEERPLDLAAAALARPVTEGVADPVRADLDSGILPDVKLIGETMFTHFGFHLQVVAVLLLVATVGVVILSKRELK
jgi:NADH-quinone oxidoreductase subunit J